MKRKLRFGLRAMFLAPIVLGAVLGLVARQLRWIHGREGALAVLYPSMKRALSITLKP